MLSLRRAAFSPRIRRSFVTAAQKRALNKKQVEGTAGTQAGGASKPPPSTPPPAPPAETAGKTAATPPPPPTSGGGGSSSAPLIALAALGAGGAAYYYDVLGLKAVVTKEDETPALVKKEEKKVSPAVEKSVVLTEEKSIAETEPSTQKVEEEAPAVVEGDQVVDASKTEPAASEPDAAPSKSEEPSGAAGNRVTTISFPPKQQQPITVAVHHPEGGNRVAMAPHTSTADESTVDKALRELNDQSEKEANEALRKAHTLLRANLEEGLLKDLDTLSPAELKIRIVQLASEMNERTKWEAVRLQEMIRMKEKETSEKFAEVLQKQRNEFEDSLARRLREQEDSLTRQANAALQQRENAIESIINDTTEALNREHQAKMKSSQEQLSLELQSKYEEEMGNKLAQEKLAYRKDLEEKLATISELTTALSHLESALKLSREYESDSQVTHRLSAAALALASKLETSQPAFVELHALKSASSSNSVIASAMSNIPASVEEKGVPTVAELQHKFEKVRARCREAALVPEGRSGLEGQLMGMVFSKVTVPPTPSDDSVAGLEDSGSNNADLSLARAYYHLQEGDLARTVVQLDKLKGQAAFTVKDWKAQAKDRLAVDQAAKVIKMECALLNENLAGR